MFQIEAIGFWEDEPEVVTATIDLVTLAKIVRMIGTMKYPTPDDGLSSFYHDVTSKLFNRLYEDGVNDVG